MVQDGPDADPDDRDPAKNRFRGRVADGKILRVLFEDPFKLTDIGMGHRSRHAGTFHIGKQEARPAVPGRAFIRTTAYFSLFVAFFGASSLDRGVTFGFALNWGASSALILAQVGSISSDSTIEPTGHSAAHAPHEIQTVGSMTMKSFPW
jgi:hypothetical protein